MKKIFNVECVLQSVHKGGHKFEFYRVAQKRFELLNCGTV